MTKNENEAIDCLLVLIFLVLLFTGLACFGMICFALVVKLAKLLFG